MYQQIADTYFYAGNTIDNDTVKIAGFDLDWTLIRPVKSIFPKLIEDWALLPNRIVVLKEYIKLGYTIVIFTNQSGKGKVRDTKLSRVLQVKDLLNNEGINPWIFVATGKNSYRKPETGMWQLLDHLINLPVDKSKSFYVGDAAGRPQDFAPSDKEFAENIGITFYVPEQVFPNNQVPIPSSQTLFIFVGMSGSGKTTFYQQKLQPLGWVHANQDILKTKVKVLKTVDNALKLGQSVAVDATNPTVEGRKAFIDLAIKYQVPTLIIHFVGDGHAYNKLRVKPVPIIAYSMYFKRLVEPSYQIDRVNVIQVML